MLGSKFFGYTYTIVTAMQQRVKTDFYSLGTLRYYFQLLAMAIVTNSKHQEKISILKCNTFLWDIKLNEHSRFMPSGVFYRIYF